MIFSVSNNGIEWSLEFGQDSIILNVKDVVQVITIISQAIPLTALNLLLSQTKAFLKTIRRKFQLPPTRKERWR